MTAHPHDCVARVYPCGGPHLAGGFQCTRTGTVKFDGRWWCWQHAPVAKQRRQKARDLRYDEEWKREKAASRQKQLKRDIAHAMIRWITEGVVPVGVPRKIIDMVNSYHKSTVKP